MPIAPSAPPATPPGAETRADQNAAAAQFRRSLWIITATGMLMAAASLWYLSLFGQLHLHMAIATLLGVFLSVLLGSGLFAAAFYSARSGHDQSVTDATHAHDDRSSPGT